MGGRRYGKPALCQQILMRALLAQAALMENENAVGMLDGAQPVHRPVLAITASSSRSSACRMSISVLVSTLEVASSRIRKRGSCAKARAKLMSWRWPTGEGQAALA